MAESFFVDTGYLIALEVSSDQHHAAAQSHWRSLERRSLALVTTTYVLDEVVTFFNSRGLHTKAVEVGERLLASAAISLIHVDEPLFEVGWQLFKQHQDKRYSLTDCISFAVMQERGLRQALAFDHHFVQAGFEPLPGTSA